MHPTMSTDLHLRYRQLLAIRYDLLDLGPS